MRTATMAVATIPVTDLERAKRFYGTIGVGAICPLPVGR